MMDLLPDIPPNAPVPTASSRSNWRSALKGLVFGGLLASSVVAVMLSFDKTALRNALGGLSHTPWKPLLIALIALLAIAMHELGHVIGGLLVRFRFVMYIVGPLRVARDESGRIRIGLNRSLASAGGLAALHPVDQHNLRARFAWLVAGGPLASLTSAAIAGFAATQTSGAPRALCVIYAFCSGGITMATAFPTTTGMYLTDGARLLQLLRHGAAGERDAALLTMMASNTIGTPLEQWAEDLIVRGTTPVDGSIFEMQGRLYAYMWTLAHGSLSDARTQLTRALALTVGLPAGMKRGIRLELAFLDALAGADIATIEEHAHFLQNQLTPADSRQVRLRSQAAIAARRGQSAEARALLDEARQLAAGVATRTSGHAWELARLQQIEGMIVS